MSTIFKKLFFAELSADKEQRDQDEASKNAEIASLKAEVECFKAKAEEQETAAVSAKQDLDKIASEKATLEETLVDTETKLKGKLSISPIFGRLSTSARVAQSVER